MRGDANMKRLQALTGLLSSLVLVATVAGCDGNPDLPEQTQNLDYPGHAVVGWTLNGVALTADTCTSDRITSMNVYVVSRQDRDQNVEFENVTCGLDRYSMAMVPEGSVRVFVDAVRDTGNGQEPCVLYSGQADLTAGSSFAAKPTALALQFVAKCQ